MSKQCYHFLKWPICGTLLTTFYGLYLVSIKHGLFSYDLVTSDGLYSKYKHRQSPIKSMDQKHLIAWHYINISR